MKMFGADITSGKGRKTYSCESDTGTGTRGLVHLTEHERDLGLAVQLNDGSLLHFVVQIVALTGTLTDTSKDGETTVGLGDVVLDCSQLPIRSMGKSRKILTINS